MSEKETYSLFISSTDKISGSNNNGQYNINWDDFLPRGYNFFKMIFNFQTSGGNYKDFSGTGYSQATAGAVTASTSVTLTAANPNIAVGMVVSNTSIVSHCYVTAINGTALKLSSPQTISSGTTLTFNAVNFFAAGKVVFNTGGKSHSFDTKSMSQSSTIGYIHRDIQTSASSSNTLSCFFSQNAPKTISRPNQNVVTISIYNACPTTATNGLLVDTNTSGNALASDMNNWNMIIEFVPIEDSIQPNHVNF